MAQITLTVDDADVPRIVTAFELRYGAKPPAETNGQFVKRHISDSVNRFVKDALATEAKRGALANYVDLDIT